MPAIKLTKAQWSEIYYAVHAKHERVERGDYRCAIAEDQSDEDKQLLKADEDEIQNKWALDLLNILEAIGPDGETAVKEGVQPCN